MRQLINTFVTLAFLMIGFAHLQPAHAVVMGGGPPVLLSFTIDPFMWFENEDIIGGDIDLIAFDNAGEPIDVFLSTDGPIIIAMESFFGLGPFHSEFGYSAFTGMGDFLVTATLTNVIDGSIATHTIDYLVKPAPVPEPSTLLVFAIGLAGLGFVRRRRSMGIGEAKSPS